MINLKFKKIISVSLFLMLLVTIAAFYFIVFAEEHTIINNKEYIIRIENADMFFNITDGFVYFGRDTCPICYRFFPILEEIVNVEQIEVFYFDTDYFRENELLTREELQELFKNYEITHVPIIIRLVDGILYESFTPPSYISEESLILIRNSTNYFLSLQK
ncbi:MAG: thioredoxin family protein [Defluviitaleaceae bacterium]|nr:thioredoxin family protein [Defluviitaleaceae bacterium]